MFSIGPWPNEKHLMRAVSFKWLFCTKNKPFGLQTIRIQVAWPCTLPNDYRRWIVFFSGTRVDFSPTALASPTAYEVSYYSIVCERIVQLKGSQTLHSLQPIRRPVWSNVYYFCNLMVDIRYFKMCLRKLLNLQKYLRFSGIFWPKRSEINQLQWSPR